MESWEWSVGEYYKDQACIDEDYFLEWCEGEGYLDDFEVEEEEEEEEETNEDEEDED